MDNIVLSTIIGLFAAFLTAVLGFTKLINDKEGKTSEFRQEWTGSIRITIAKLVSSLRHLSVLHERHFTRASVCDELNQELLKLTDISTSIYNITKESKDFNMKLVESLNSEILETNRIIRENLALTVLHFKPFDNEFIHVENNLKSILDIMDDVSKTSWIPLNNKNERAEYLSSNRTKIENLCNEIISITRLMLKKEWELIKSGEKNYSKTKSVFKYGSFLVASSIVVLFIYFFILKYSTILANEKTNAAVSNIIIERTLKNDFPLTCIPSRVEINAAESATGAKK